MSVNYYNLTELNISNHVNLKILFCHNNKLSRLDLSNNLGLKGLAIKNNKFIEQDLSFLSHLVNLEGLRVKKQSLYWFLRTEYE
ncbi:hypothetical protein [endosymbiont GvMRE of Glomus versiforme]|uniref:hypothetical protein n=1 Tax=endosymbiont GvMRE of Glomus versiforme TaxID=2039283 RepID=UPI0011C3C770|nr:hypothetical protein [endosymbiont GvMRE of Glomus versiforme]